MTNVAFVSLRMPVWPKIVYTFNVSLQTAATKRKLREQHGAPAKQDETFRSLTDQLAATSFWKQAGVEAGMSYSSFQSRVPVHGFEQFVPAIEQMMRGESDILWPGPCTLFGRTAGTSGGQPRLVPMTAALLAHFRRAGYEAMLYYNARARNGGAFSGRHLLYGGPPTLATVDGACATAGVAADASGIAARNFPNWVEQHLYEPGVSVAQITGWDEQVDAIAARTQSLDISLIGGVPNSVYQLAQSLRAKFSAGGHPRTNLREQWPNLQCYAYTGASITPYASELRRVMGAGVEFHEVYASSECIVAAQDGETAQGLRLMADVGVFFEFVALNDFDFYGRHQLGPRAVPVAGVKTGIDYVILLTTPGGLARYIVGDVVRFTSLAPLRLMHIGGTLLRLNAFGENVTEKELTDTLAALCVQRDWSLVNFHVAPLFVGNNLTGRQQRGSHEWWVELKPGTVVTPTGPQMAVELDASLRRANPMYAEKRAAGIVDAPTVRLVMPGVFEHWLRFYGKWGGQHKMPRCRSDRVVADEFAYVTNFARD